MPNKDIYFHQMSEGKRSLELLLNTCYNNNIMPIYARKGHGKDTLAYIVLTLDFKHLNTIGRLMDLTLEIPDVEFNIKSHNNKLYVEISSLSKDDEQLFTKINEIIEEDILNKKTHNLSIMNTVYNIYKIIDENLKADIYFVTNENLYSQSKCLMSSYKNKKGKRLTDYNKVIKNLKEDKINIPINFLCSFEDLRTFYFELDEIIYGDD